MLVLIGTGFFRNHCGGLRIVPKEKGAVNLSCMGPALKPIPKINIAVLCRSLNSNAAERV